MLASARPKKTIILEENYMTCKPGAANVKIQYAFHYDDFVSTVSDRISFGQTQNLTLRADNDVLSYPKYLYNDDFLGVAAERNFGLVHKWNKC